MIAKYRRDTKYCITKQGPHTTPPNNVSNNKHWLNNDKATTLERTAAEITDDLHAISSLQILLLLKHTKNV